MRLLTIAKFLSEASNSTSTDPNDPWGGPETLGFIFIFVIAALTMVIIFDLVRRLRKVRYKAEIQARLLRGEDVDQEDIDNSLAVDWRETTTTKSMPIINGDNAAAAMEAKTASKPQRPAAPPKPKRD
jgi:hypothetical protein